VATQSRNYYQNQKPIPRSRKKGGGTTARQKKKGEGKSTIASNLKRHPEPSLYRLRPPRSQRKKGKRTVGRKTEEGKKKGKDRKALKRIQPGETPFWERKGENDIVKKEYGPGGGKKMKTKTEKPPIINGH